MLSFSLIIPQSSPHTSLDMFVKTSLMLFWPSYMSWFWHWSANLFCTLLLQLLTWSRTKWMFFLRFFNKLRFFWNSRLSSWIWLISMLSADNLDLSFSSPVASLSISYACKISFFSSFSFLKISNNFSFSFTYVNKVA